MLPYVPHMLLMAAIIAIAWDAPDSIAVREPDAVRTGHVLSALRSRTFVCAVLLTAPWVFGAAATSFATLPSFVRVDGAQIAVTGALAGLTLWTGVAVQPLGRRFAHASTTISVGLLAGAGGLAVGALMATTDAAWLIVPAAMLLGTAYGLVLVGGLTPVESIARPDDLGTLNAVFYSLTYLGFAAPLLSTLALRSISQEALMLVGIGVIAVTLPLVRASRTTRPR